MTATAVPAPPVSGYPQITVDNTLAGPVTVYDSLNENPGDTSLANYFGTLTNLGGVGAGAGTAFTPVHGPYSVYIVYDAQNNPVKRVFTDGTTAQTFPITQADVDVITATRGFVDLLQNKPDDPVAQQFTALTRNGAAGAHAVDAFFRATAAYQTCTYISYMLVVVSLARTPASRNLPPEQQEYSLSSLLPRLLGVAWPAGLPDVIVSRFSCTDDGDLIRLGGRLTVQDVTFGDGVQSRVLSILPSPTLWFRVTVDLQPGLSVGAVQLRCLFDTLAIPLGDGTSVSFTKPTVLLSITPLFRFVVFEIEATIPFSLFGGPKFDAVAVMTIDNVEAAIGVTVDGGQPGLPAPPGVKGLHFDQVGVGMGLFFEPPGFAVGVQGTFRIGEGQQVVQLDDDRFALVCKLQADVPEPLYLCFSVPQLDLEKVVEIFTDQKSGIDFPVGLSGLSMRWAQNPLEPVVLPDGTLAPAGYGFTADLDLFGLAGHADLAIDLTNGVQGSAQLAPFSLGPVLSLTGDGPGVTVKVDAAGNPIPNNLVPTTAAARQAIAQATTKQVIPPGGAELRISTAGSPYVTVDAHLTFLGTHDDLAATVDKNGIAFTLGFGGLISGAMTCVLRDFHNFNGSFVYGPDFNVPLPEVAGVSLGSIRLTAQIDAVLTLSTSTSAVVFTASCGFDLAGISRTIGPVTLDVGLTALTDVLSAIESWLLSNAAAVFGDLIGDAGAWARSIQDSVIVPAEQDVAYVVGVLKNCFNVAVTGIGPLLQGSSYALDAVAGAVKDAFDAAAGDVADVLTSGYQATADQVGDALKNVGYDAAAIAGALESASGSTADGAAAVLRHLGFGADVTASALVGVYSVDPEDLGTALKSAGYAMDDVESVFERLPGAPAG